MIEIDLRNYAEEVKNTFCNEHDCLCSRLFNRSFENIFKSYVYDLEKNKLFYNKIKTFDEILYDLKNMAKMI